MSEERSHLTPLQVEVADLFFSLDDASGYLVAGGAALLASDLIARTTEDLDLFTSAPATSVTVAKDAFLSALEAALYEVDLIQASPTFCRMLVARAS